MSLRVPACVGHVNMPTTSQSKIITCIVLHPETLHWSFKTWTVFAGLTWNENFHSDIHPRLRREHSVFLVTSNKLQSWPNWPGRWANAREGGGVGRGGVVVIFLTSRNDITHETYFIRGLRRMRGRRRRSRSSARSGVRIVTPKTTGIKCPRPDRR